MSSCNETVASVCQYLDNQGAWYVVHDSGMAIETGVAGENGLFPICIAVHDDPSRIVEYLRVPLRAPEKRRTQMAEAITRANFGLMFGCFQLDMSDGTILYHTAIPTGDGVITEQQFLHLHHCSCVTVDAYFRAFNRLLYGDDLSPAEAIAEVEMANSEE